MSKNGLLILALAGTAAGAVWYSRQSVEPSPGSASASAAQPAQNYILDLHRVYKPDGRVGIEGTVTNTTDKTQVVRLAYAGVDAQGTMVANADIYINATIPPHMKAQVAEYPYRFDLTNIVKKFVLVWDRSYFPK